MNQVVHTQFTENIEVQFTSSIHDGKQLAERYAGLVDVDPYNAVERDQLDDAIRTVRNARTENERERKSYLAPFTEHQRAVNAICKKIQAPIIAIESRLKGEKQRVDSFLADRHAALQKEWRAEVVALEARGQVKYGAGLDVLEKNLEWLKSVDPLDECFGELTADASAARTAAIMNTVNAIATEVDRREVAAAKAELEAVKASLAAEKQALAQAQAEVLESAQTAVESPVTPAVEPFTLELVNDATVPVFDETQMAEIIALLVTCRRRLEVANYETDELKMVASDVLKHLRAATKEIA